MKASTRTAEPIICFQDTINMALFPIKWDLLSFQLIFVNDMRIWV